MAAIPGGLDTDRQPPMTVPLRHFVVGLGFLLAGTSLGVGLAAGVVPGLGGLAHVHLLLAGWICITIMGAMTQFVPVWSGVALHSRRLANVQLGLVTVGLVGFVLAFVTFEPVWLAIFGTITLAGFWTFVYNVARTLPHPRNLDVTERHFVYALTYFLALTLLGVLLALDFTIALFADVPLTRDGVLGAHVAVAVFGAVLTTVYGALYQLATMFTQTELHALDRRLQSVEELAHPLGVVILAGGRLAEHVAFARVGGLMIVIAALSVSVVLLRKLAEMQVPRTPMHTRYAIVALALGSWALLAAPAWAIDATDRAHLLGAEGTLYLLVLGAIGFVVLGTLYHVVPFIVWVHRYSDRLGLEPVPMIDDLYDDRLAAVDFWFILSGTLVLVGADWFGFPSFVTVLGGGVVVVGALVFVANMLAVVVRHGQLSLDRLVLGALTPRRLVSRSDDPPTDDEPTDEAPTSDRSS